MPKYVIEREIPGLGDASAEDLRAVAQKSNAVLAELAPQVQWVQSYATQDKMYCIYVADDAESVREHARRGGFPADSVAAVAAVVDPTTAEG
ncbi:DUF4242 domain-containing protein [Pseudonocardia charpentierae]|jgi:hypothetical protein|uniref:DUF4242 domain-containing protein n=1 Tax=Pseudonocardia charpentierae TaxID=3075545 RepID=A0ABU2N4V0_9PSEU|nr:DUF4242 domain-containing protein [Pseudonocardia sp. DSM 45834]MDT0348915.1 DUF4242 domain-containing protein [Pseudonocardia sp. DSM 45834]HSU10101.1 DUF4242 domain-containing protein [Pseudonocardia sp.]